MKRTLIQFGSGAEAVVAEDDAPTATECPTCGNHFSGDARFCPFDGDALREAPDWDPSGDPLIGSLVDGRYEVLEVLGEGGMGTVYRARHVALGRHFAIKALRRDLSQDSELAVRFIQEAKAAAAVAHPAVVQITDFGTLESGQPYFVMELLDGRALSRVIREHGALPPMRAAHIARQVAEALAAAHDAGVIHRDLKPDNIHLADVTGERDLVKVLDFGLAKVAGGSRLTRQGMVFGTPHYMSPEQAAGEPIDHRVDIYSLGIVLYEMLTGRLPFEADSFMGVLSKHIYMEPPAPSQLLGRRDDLAPLEKVTLRCLAKKPANRYATMHELVGDLDAVRHSLAPASRVRVAGVDGHGALSGAAVDLEPPVIPTRPRWPLVGTLGLAGVALFVLIAWRLASDEPVRPAVAEPAVSAREAPVAAPETSAPPPPASAASPAPSASAPPPTPPPQAARRPPAVRTAPAPTPRPTQAPRPQKAAAGEIINPWGE